MTEEYVGTKFEVVFRGEAELDRKAGELVAWAVRLKAEGLTPPYLYAGRECSAGNLSYRRGNGFVITPSGKDVDELKADDLVQVIECAGGRVVVRGKREPSSETLMHCLVYGKRKDVNAVFHGHDEAVLKNAAKLGLPSTSVEKQYGTLELAEEVAQALGEESYLVIKNHGFLAVGKTMDEAGRKALEIHERALKVNK